MKLDYKKLRELVKKSVEENCGGMVHPTAAPAPITIIPNAKPDDLEGKMAKQQVFGMINDASQLEAMLLDEDQLPGWVQSKLSRASDYISAVKKYLEYELARGSAAPAPAAGLPLPPMMENILVEKMSIEELQELEETLKKAFVAMQDDFAAKSIFRNALKLVKSRIAKIEINEQMSLLEAKGGQAAAKEKAEGSRTKVIQVAKHMFKDPQLADAIKDMAKDTTVMVPQFLAILATKVLKLGVEEGKPPNPARSFEAFVAAAKMSKRYFKEFAESDNEGGEGPDDKKKAGGDAGGETVLRPMPGEGE